MMLACAQAVCGLPEPAGQNLSTAPHAFAMDDVEPAGQK